MQDTSINRQDLSYKTEDTAETFNIQQVNHTSVNCEPCFPRLLVTWDEEED